MTNYLYCPVSKYIYFSERVEGEGKRVRGRRGLRGRGKVLRGRGYEKKG